MRTAKSYGDDESDENLDENLDEDREGDSSMSSASIHESEPLNGSAGRNLNDIIVETSDVETSEKCLDTLQAVSGEDETQDAIGQGGLRLLQHRRGYRFTVDALLLADFARQAIGKGPFIDLGTGCGVIALAVAMQSKRQGVGVELQSGLATLARRNVRLNGLDDRVEILQGDFRQLKEQRQKYGAAFQCVLSNPPFFSLETGRVNPQSERALARHEMTGCLGDVTNAARWMLKDGGSLCVVYPAHRLVDVMAHFTRCKLTVRHLRFVHPKSTAPANLLLAEGVKNAPNMKLSVLKPLFLADEAGMPSPESDELVRKIGIP